MTEPVANRIESSKTVSLSLDDLFIQLPSRWMVSIGDSPGSGHYTQTGRSRITLLMYEVD